MKGPTQITEIRVIPLGATVDLSTGSYQLGATNPSEFELEVYYNDLQVSTKSTFELLKNFKFNDKSRIQLVCDPNERIITDGILVRGTYSTVTLAVYGYKVDEVPIKPVVSEIKEQPLPPQIEIPVCPPESHAQIGSPEKFVELESEADTVIGAEREAEAEVKVLVIPNEGVGQTPQAIPTITTRVNYDPGQGSVDESFSDQTMDHDQKETDDSVDEKLSQEKSLPNAEKLVPVVAEVMADTEEISDGEVPSDDDDQMLEESHSKDDDSLMKELDAETHKVENVLEISIADSTAKIKIDPLIEEVEPISSPPQEQFSDVEDSLLDEFPSGPGFEQIDSDEEVPDFPEYEYDEWEDYAHKFIKTFNPFSESFQVSSLHNVHVTQTSFAACKRLPVECWELLLTKSDKFSKAHFRSNLMESWVEDIERLIPLIPSALNHHSKGTAKERSCIECALWLWVDIGTDLKMAMEQPSLPFKTRHVKAGVRLIQCLANLEGPIVETLLNLELLPFEDQEPRTKSITISIQHRLIDLLIQPYMNTAGKLLIMRTLDAIVSTRLGYLKFTNSEKERSCYQQLVDFTLKPGLPSRIAFSFRSLHKKIKLMQGLSSLEKRVKALAVNSPPGEESVPVIESSELEEEVLEDLRSTAQNENQLFSHPLRFIPASSVVELPQMNSAGHDPRASFVRMLKEMNFIQVSAVIVSSKVFGTLVGQISEILEILLRWEVGLIYLCNESDSTTILLRSLLQLDEDISIIASRAAHCMEVMKCIDTLSSQCLYTDSEEEKDEDIRSLQTVVSFLTNAVGREALSTTLSKGDFILPFLKCIKSSDSDPRFGKLSRLEKSARKGYAVDILDFVIRNCDSIEFLEKHGSMIYNIISSLSERNEGNEKLLTVQLFLKPVLNSVVLTLDGVETLCDIIKTKKDELFLLPMSIETNWGFPAELITALRILCSLATAPDDNDVSKNLLADTDEMNIRQLKYDMAVVKLHSLDIVSTLIGVIEKVLKEFQQPAIHSHEFVGCRGDALLSLLLPLIKVLKKTISQVVQVKKAEFRDISAVAVLVKLYGLVEYYPSNALSYSKAQELGQNVVSTLLAYTVPAIKYGAETEEELNRSTWTAVISEIIKFTLDEPATFIPGVALFTEMLPLPFPLASRSPLTEQSCEDSVKLRRLWSAYIHGLSPQLQDMIGTLCMSTNGKLLNLLKRVCVQLADLSAATCLVVCRAILDKILESMEVELEPVADSQPSGTQTSSVKAWVDTAKGPGECQCSPTTSRILGFLATLVNNYAPMKCAVLYAMKGTTKVDEKYGDLLTYFCSVLLTNPAPTTLNSHIQGQDHVVTIFQSFCDVEINMLVPMFGRTEKSYDSEFLLTNSLPQRDPIICICSILLTYLSQMDGKFTNNSQIVEGILRTLEIISETDYGFYHLRVSLEKAPGSLSKIAKSFILSEINNSDNFEALLPCMMSFLDLMKSITTARSQQMGSFPPRASFLTPEELCRFLEWKEHLCDSRMSDSKKGIVLDCKEEEPVTKRSGINISKLEEEIAMEVDSSTPDQEATETCKRSSEASMVHPLAQIQIVFENIMKQLKDSSLTLGTAEASDLNIGLIIINNLLKTLEENMSSEQNTESWIEIVLPPSESLSELYSIRPVFVLVERMGADNLFWLTSIPPAFELETENVESELVPYDLEELCRKYLGSYDVVKEIDNLAKASGLQSSNAKVEVKRSDVHFKRMDGGMGAPPTPLGHRRHQFNATMRGGPNRGGFNRALLSGPGRLNMYDPFRSRPPNTSRPPSLHVDDFVAMESSGQSGAAPSRPGGSDNFSSRGRGPRGGLLSRPYSHDRGRNSRTGPLQGGYFQPQRHDSSKGRGSRGGRVYTTPTSDRWTADNRGVAQGGYERNIRVGNYDDKYRSGGSIGPNRNSVSSPRVHLQPYPQRPGYRDARPAMNNSPRWRDRQRPFNR